MESDCLTLEEMAQLAEKVDNWKKTWKSTAWHKKKDLKGPIDQYEVRVYIDDLCKYLRKLGFKEKGTIEVRAIRGNESLGTYRGSEVVSIYRTAENKFEELEIEREKQRQTNRTGLLEKARAIIQTEK